MATNPTTPFWLEIKTEYIDANLDKVIAYLSKESAEPGTDPFYEETERLLGKRVHEMMEELSNVPIWQEEGEDMRNRAIAALRILGAWLLIQDSLKGVFCSKVYFFFLQSLSKLVPDANAEDLAAIAVQSLTRDGVNRPGFNWGDIKNVQPDVYLATPDKDVAQLVRPGSKGRGLSVSGKASWRSTRPTRPTRSSPRRLPP